MGRFAAPTPEAHDAVTNSAAHAPSAAGSQPSSSGTRHRPRSSPCTIKTGTPNPTAPLGNAGFSSAFRPAGRNLGLWRTSHTKY